MSRNFGHKRPWNQKGRLTIVYKAKEGSRFGRMNGKERKFLQGVPQGVMEREGDRPINLAHVPTKKKSYTPDSNLIVVSVLTISYQAVDCKS